jgi:hypothetical protein
MFRTGNYPSSSFQLNSIEDDGWHSALVFEGSRIPLITNLPSDEHKERGHSLPSSAMSKNHGSPPMFHTIEVMPRGGVKVLDVKPIPNHSPNMDG